MAVTFTEQLLARAQAWADSPLNSKRGPEGLAELATLYSAITGEPAGACKQCQFSDFSASVRAYIREATHLFFPELMKKSTTYTFALGFEDAILSHESYGKAVTAENITDEDGDFFATTALAPALQKNGHKLAAPTARAAAAPATDTSKSEKPGKAAKKAAKQAIATAPADDSPERKPRVSSSNAPEAAVATSPQIDGKPVVLADGGLAGPTV